jgi:hypothetical protein
MSWREGFYRRDEHSFLCFLLLQIPSKQEEGMTLPWVLTFLPDEADRDEIDGEEMTTAVVRPPASIGGIPRVEWISSRYLPERVVGRIREAGLKRLADLKLQEVVVVSSKSSARKTTEVGENVNRDA